MDFSLNRDTFYSKYGNIFGSIFMGAAGILIAFYLLNVLSLKIFKRKIKIFFKT
jgi:hypothetical protein